MSWCTARCSRSASPASRAASTPAVLPPEGGQTALATRGDNADNRLSQAVAFLLELESKRRREREAPAFSLGDKLVLTLDEAAKLSGLSRGFILREAIEEKRLKARILGRGWKVKREDLESYVRKL